MGAFTVDKNVYFGKKSNIEGILFACLEETRGAVCSQIAANSGGFGIIFYRFPEDTALETKVFKSTGNLWEFSWEQLDPFLESEDWRSFLGVIQKWDLFTEWRSDSLASFILKESDADFGSYEYWEAPDREAFERLWHKHSRPFESTSLQAYSFQDERSRPFPFENMTVLEHTLLYQRFGAATTSFFLVDGESYSPQRPTFVILDCAKEEQTSLLALRKRVEANPTLLIHLFKRLLNEHSIYAPGYALGVIRDKGLPKEMHPTMVRYMYHHLLTEDIYFLAEIEALLLSLNLSEFSSASSQDILENLARLCGSDNPHVRRISGTLLLHFDVLPSAETLTSLAADEDLDVRIRIAQLFPRIASEDTTNTLQRLLNDPSPEVKCTLLQSLRAARKELPFETIRQLLKDPERDVRNSAFKSALYALEPTEELIPVLHELLSAPHSDMRLAATKTLSRLIQPKEKAFEALTSIILSSRFSNVRRAASEHLGDIALASESTYESFISLIRTKRLKSIHGNIVSALISCFSKEEAKPWADRFGDLLRDDDDNLLMVAASVLTWIGTEAHVDRLRQAYELKPLEELRLAILVLDGDFRLLEDEAAKKGVKRPWGAFHDPRAHREWKAYEAKIQRARVNWKKQASSNKLAKLPTPSARSIDKVVLEAGTKQDFAKRSRRVIDALEKQFKSTNHFLDHWLSSLDEIEFDGLRAFIVKEWPFSSSAFLENIRQVERWNAEHIKLARTIFRLSAEEISEFLNYLSQCDLDLEAEEEDSETEEKKEHLRSLLHAWEEPMESLTVGAEAELVSPSPIFSIKFEIEGAMSFWVWGWNGIAFTKDYVLVSEWDNRDLSAYDISSWIPNPLGLVPRENMFQCAALLLMHCKNLESHEDRFSGEDDEVSFWHQITISGINKSDLYRVLLAAQRRGGYQILRMARNKLVTFKEEHMVRGYSDLAKIVRKQQRGSSIL